MILSGLAIQKAVNSGQILIDPFNSNQLNPNSYNLRLGDELRVYAIDARSAYLAPLDPYKDNPTRSIRIPEEGFVLKPGELYLGATLEYTETYGYVPRIDGRSSTGRLGIFVHVTAGFGDVGFCGNWTLEIACLRPVKIYPGMQICQISYHTVSEEYDGYSGRYQNSKGVVASRFYKG